MTFWVALAHGPHSPVWVRAVPHISHFGPGILTSLWLVGNLAVVASPRAADGPPAVRTPELVVCYHVSIIAGNPSLRQPGRLPFL